MNEDVATTPGTITGSITTQHPDQRAAEPSHSRVPAPRIHWPLALLALVLPLAAMAWRAAHWADIPSSFPRHYGLNGQPTAYVAKGFWSVFAPGLIGVVAVVVLTLIPLLYGRPGVFSRSGDGSGFRLGAAFTSFTLEVISLLVGISTGYLQLALPSAAGPSRTALIVLPLIEVVIVFVLALAYRARRRAQDDAPVATADGHARNWIWKTIYYNPDDPAVLVPRLHGYGITINMATVPAKLFMVFVALVLLVAIAGPLL